MSRINMMNRALVGSRTVLHGGVQELGCSRSSAQRSQHNLKRADLPLSLHRPDKNIFKLDKGVDQLRILVPTWKYLKESEAKRLQGLLKLALAAAKEGSNIWIKVLEEWRAAARAGVLRLSSRLIVVVREKEWLNVGRGGGASQAMARLNRFHHHSAATLATIMPRIRLFELPKFLQDRLPLKKGEGKKTCRPVEPKLPPKAGDPATHHPPPHHDLVNNINEKWVKLRDRLPGWQENIAKRLQQVQDVVNKKLPKE